MKKNDNGKRTCRITASIMAGAFALMLLPTASNAAGGSRKTLRLGTSFSITEKNASYKSSNEDVAWVNDDGIVTGKKQGKATIRIRKGNKVTRQKVTVVANGKKKKGVGVSTGEIALKKSTITYSQVTEGNNNVSNSQANPHYHYSASIIIKNCGKKNAAKVTIDTEIAGKKTTFSFGKVKAGSKSTATAEGEVAASQIPEIVESQRRGTPNHVTAQLSCRKLKVYSGKMYTSYDYDHDETSYHWGTPDTTPPVITGFVEKNSYNQKMPYQIIYSNDKHYNFFKYVTASDDRDGKVHLSVNTKKLNLKKAGIYRVTYMAEDKAGNVKRAWAKIEVRKTKQVDEIADEVLSGIIKKNWSVKRKATAIYNYTRKHISYVGTSNKKSWEQEAINGIRYGKGDCFTYYAVARALLTRAGIPNIEVTRYRGKGHHWWNMVYAKGGWYHYDRGPRIGGGRFCLLTDSQLTNYSKSHGNKYIWNYKKLPKSPKKKLSTIF